MNLTFLACGMVLALLTGFVLARLLARAGGTGSRLERALGVAGANLMVLDEGEQVVHANRDGAGVLRALQTDLPGGLVALSRTQVRDLTVDGIALRVTATPVFQAGGARCGTMIEWLDRQAELVREETQREQARIAQEAALQAARVRQALDAANAGVMVTDEHNVIVHLNRTAQQLMQASQEEFRRKLPGFDASRLMNASFDVFSPLDAGRRELLPPLDQAFSSELQIGARTLRVIANPIVDSSGNRLGSVVEWSDRTQEIAVEGEVQAVIADALQGNLERRIRLEGKQGFIRGLSTGINALVENVAAMVAEVQTLVQAVNDGHLDQRIRTEGGSGLTAKLGAGINELTSNVAEVVDHVQELVHAANDGDLSRRIHTEGRSGLMGKLAQGVNQLTHGMAGVVSQVKVAAGEVNRGADEITTGNATLSRRMEEQASSLEETASSMEEMTSTVRQNADNAAQANQLAVAARDQAEKGGAVVSRAVQAMSEINRASTRIADIIGVIDEIAFQTNLLALNAAVEAARAGEQGRGFAVVATEVRNLAGRSATAAKEIKALINDSVQKVEDGSKLVSQSGATLEQIVAAVKRVTDIVAEIAAASHEQSAGIDQVTRAVLQLDEITQQNAALVEQASSASHAMAGQARSLHTLMQRYDVAGDETPDVEAILEGRTVVKPPPRRAAASGGADVWIEF